MKFSTPALIHCPRTYLESALTDATNTPPFLTLAAKETNPVEKLKLIATGYIAG